LKLLNVKDFKSTKKANVPDLKMIPRRQIIKNEPKVHQSNKTRTGIGYYLETQHNSVSHHFPGLGYIGNPNTSNVHKKITLNRTTVNGKDHWKNAFHNYKGMSKDGSGITTTTGNLDTSYDENGRKTYGQNLGFGPIFDQNNSCVIGTSPFKRDFMKFGESAVEVLNGEARCATSNERTKLKRMMDTMFPVVKPNNKPVKLKPTWNNQSVPLISREDIEAEISRDQVTANLNQEDIMPKDAIIQEASQECLTSSRNFVDALETTPRNITNLLVENEKRFSIDYQEEMLKYKDRALVLKQSVTNGPPGVLVSATVTPMSEKVKKLKAQNVGPGIHATKRRKISHSSSGNDRFGNQPKNTHGGSFNYYLGGAGFDKESRNSPEFKGDLKHCDPKNFMNPDSQFGHPEFPKPGVSHPTINLPLNTVQNCPRKESNSKVENIYQAKKNFSQKLVDQNSQYLRYHSNPQEQSTLGQSLEDSNIYGKNFRPCNQQSYIQFDGKQRFNQNGTTGNQSTANCPQFTGDQS
jgi:hypothetical protein